MYLLILPNWSGKKLRLQCVDLWEVCEVHWLYASINKKPVQLDLEYLNPTNYMVNGRFCNKYQYCVIVTKLNHKLLFLSLNIWQYIICLLKILVLLAECALHSLETNDVISNILSLTYDHDVSDHFSYLSDEWC